MEGLVSKGDCWLDRLTGLIFLYHPDLKGYVTIPQIRLTVLESNTITGFPRFLIGLDGITVGRDRSFEKRIRIADVEVSKFHAQIYHQAPIMLQNAEESKNDHSTFPRRSWDQFYIIDHGSRNGTFLNTNRLSAPKVTSAPQKLAHGDVLKIGGTIFFVHLHPKWPHCCEQCAYAGSPLESLGDEKHWKSSATDDGTDGDSKEITLGKEALEQQRKKEKQYLKRLFIGEDSEGGVSPAGWAYRDRAEERRKEFGIDYSMIEEDKKRLQAMQEKAATKEPTSMLLSSAPTPENPFKKKIGSENKGNKMLKAMGWKEGEGLGKEKRGISDPIEVKLNQGTTGLGHQSVDTKGLSVKEATKKALYQLYDRK